MIHSSSMTCPFIWDDPFFSYPNRGIVGKKHHRCSPPATATPVGGEDVSAGQIQATLRRWAVHRLPMVPMLPHKLKPGESRPMPTSHLAPIWSFTSAFPLRRSRSGGVFPPRKTESVGRLVVHPQCMDNGYMMLIWLVWIYVVGYVLYGEKILLISPDKILRFVWLYNSY